MDSFVWRHVGRSGSNEMPLFVIRSGRRNGWKEIRGRRHTGGPNRIRTAGRSGAQ
jgi:hypothetical protein